MIDPLAAAVLDCAHYVTLSPQDRLATILAVAPWLSLPQAQNQTREHDVKCRSSQSSAGVRYGSDMQTFQQRFRRAGQAVAASQSAAASPSPTFAQTASQDAAQAVQALQNAATSIQAAVSQGAASLKPLTDAVGNPIVMSNGSPAMVASPTASSSSITAPMTMTMGQMLFGAAVVGLSAFAGSYLASRR